MTRAMNTELRDGDQVYAYAPVGLDGEEIRVLVVVDGGECYAKLPGDDAGIVKVDPASIFVVTRRSARQ